MKKRKKRIHGVEEIRRRQGYTFIIHWVIGLIVFILVPIISSIRYSFSDVSIDADGISVKFAGLKYYKEILFSDPSYLDNLRDSIGNLIYTLPIILALSLIFAVLLNQQFVGRTVARAIYFLPVILATTNILSLMNSGNVRGSSIVVYSGAEYSYGSIIDFNEILQNLSLPNKIIEVFSNYLQNVFSLIFDCGVQIILFLAGLQNIPSSLYEVSKIEGATKWEEFWFITIPMLRNVISLVLIYTMIEYFTSLSNPVIRQAYSALQDRQIYDLSSAMLCFYFLIGLSIMGLIVLLYNKYCMMYWFRVSAGKPAPGAPYASGNGHFENNLYGQTAGMFLMSAGTALLWQEDKQLRDTMNSIVDEIAEYAPEDGCIIPVEKKDRFTLEYPNYVRAWLTFGLLAAGYAGNETAFKLARRLGDWFNNDLESPKAKDMNLGFQGILANTELYLSPVGTKKDLDTAQAYYREDWWLDKLLKNDSDALYRHPNHPHGTVLTAIEGYLDIYRITGEEKLLECVKNVLNMVEKDWQHIGGGIVMCEQTDDPHYPGCNFISSKYAYNELCCTTFWILLNQRMSLIEKDNPHYYDQIEESLYNMLAAAQADDTGYHYLGRLEGSKDYRYVDIATCCAATGSRLVSMLPQFLYTYDSNTVYINIYSDSVIQAGGSEIEVKTDLPYGGNVNIKINKWKHKRLKIRIPCWCASSVTVLGVTANPGEYLTLENIADGTDIKIDFPFAVKAVLYKGADAIPEKERYAFKYGPLLLCALRSKNASVICNIDNPVLKPTENGRFILGENYQLEFLPYMDIKDEPFTVYPVVETKK